jgi:protein gp37
MFTDKERFGQNPNIVVRSKTTFRDPLTWPKVPTLCFTCSWSDWLIEEADPWRDEAYDVIRRTPWVTYQILTKRIERAAGRVPDPPLANIWLGVSVESQKTLRRIELLRHSSATLDFISFEPVLEDLEKIDLRGIDWAIIGGESGPNARRCDITWIRHLVQQCRESGVAVFIKQLGAKPRDGETLIRLKDRKGGDPNEWPPDLRVREWPKTMNAETNQGWFDGFTQPSEGR